jgi:hypothetical protein
MNDAGPPQVVRAPFGGQRSTCNGKRGGTSMNDAGPPQVVRAPLGGSAAHAMASVGAHP